MVSGDRGGTLAKQSILAVALSVPQYDSCLCTVVYLALWYSKFTYVIGTKECTIWTRSTCVHAICLSYVSGRRKGGNIRFRLHFTVIFVFPPSVLQKGVGFWFDSSQDASASGVDQTYTAGNFLRYPNLHNIRDPQPINLNKWTFVWTFELMETFTQVMHFVC